MQRALTMKIGRSLLCLFLAHIYRDNNLGFYCFNNCCQASFCVASYHPTWLQYAGGDSYYHA